MGAGGLEAWGLEAGVLEARGQEAGGPEAGGLEAGELGSWGLVAGGTGRLGPGGGRCLESQWEPLAEEQRWALGTGVSVCLSPRARWAAQLAAEAGRG